MDYKRFDILSICRLLIIIIGAFMAGVGLAASHWMYVPIGIILIIFGCYTTISNDNKTIKMLHTIAEAISNNDYSFRLPNKSRTQRDKAIFNIINKIASTLQSEKIESVQQEKYYELIINSMSIGVLVIDENDNIVKCNNETLRLFNRNALTHLSQLQAWDNLDTTLSSFTPKEKRHLLIKTPQRELNISVHLDQIAIKDSTLRIFTINDIHTEIDRNEFDSWVKLTRVLTHEIMNGIAPISSLSDTMKQDESLPHNIKDGLDAISASSHSLINFVESYRRFTRIPTPKPTLVYVSELLKQVQELYSSHDITINVEPADLIVYADEPLILQVITNIVKNATEALGDRTDGKIMINAYCDTSEQVKIAIANNGPAIPKDVAEEIFVPFFTTKSDGNGIGLSVSRQIMILSGGNLSLSSTPHNKYTTTFILTFN